MKIATVSFAETEIREIKDTGNLFEKMETRLKAGKDSSAEIILFPALLGNLSGEYAEMTKELSLLYPESLICPGSYWENAGDKLYHTSFLIYKGEILLSQRQLYLAKWEQKAGLSRGKEITFVNFKRLKLGILLSTDVFYPQVARYMALSGVDLVLSPLALKGNKNLPLQISGLWQKVQQNLFFAMESGFKGEFAGNNFFSQSIIHAPLAMTKKEKGFLAREREKTSLLVAQLNQEARKEAMRKFNPLAQLNPKFYGENLFQSKTGME